MPNSNTLPPIKNKMYLHGHDIAGMLKDWGIQQLPRPDRHYTLPSKEKTMIVGKDENGFFIAELSSSI